MSVQLHTGTVRIRSAFEGGRAALIPCLPLGYPDARTSLDIISAAAQAGAGPVVLGIPFSDPLAGDPVSLHASQSALENGMDTARCLEMVAGLRSRAVDVPLVLETYTNPVLAYGLERFVHDAAAAGADGFIIPDLPLEEAAELDAACRQHGLAITFQAASTTPDERLARFAAHSSAFLHLTSLCEEEDSRLKELENLVARVKAVTALPAAVEIGSASPQHVRRAARFADGVILASGLVKAVQRAANPAASAANYIAGLRKAVEQTAVVED